MKYSLNVNFNFVKMNIKQRLQDQFIQRWFTDMNNSSRGEYYSNFKHEFRLEPYLLKLKSGQRVHICKLRVCNIKFPIETGRWRKIPRDERLCTVCGSGLGDEYHYLSECIHNIDLDIRRKFIPIYYTRYPNREKMYSMLKYCNVKLFY